MRWNIDAAVLLPTMFRPAPTGVHGMMRDMFDRFILAATAVAIAAAGLASPAHADPQCPASGCPHGPGNSPSYKDGYKTEHDYFSTPQNHQYLKSEMQNGYTAASACQVEMGGGSPPPNPADWISGCVDALHDLGFKP
jgi:hypothetical protein